MNGPSSNALCVIPARGGSRRIPRKNLRSFHGRPMIAWSISTALESELFSRVVVSTDDEEVAALARAEGALTPFERPAALADDHTPTAPVVAHAIEECEALWGEQSLVCCLYATAPFALPEDLAAALALLKSSGADYALPVTTFPFPIQRSVRLRTDGRIEMFSPEHALTRSQDLEEAYHDAGWFYWGRRAAWLADKSVLGTGAAGLQVPRNRVQDIDTEEDWARAEKLFALLGES